jgi:SanA protein
VPKDRFVLDYAGFRTLDSVVRAKSVFGRDSVTIISQEFHNVRALYLAENVGVDAIAFNALYPIYRKSVKIIIREKLARVKVVLDVLLGVKPKFEK